MRHHIRILHLTSALPAHFVGGAELFVRDVARQQQALGHTALVAGRGEQRIDAAGDDLPYLRIGAPAAPQRELGTIACWRRRLHRLGTQLDITLAARLAAIIRRHRPEVIHTHSMSALSPLTWEIAHSMGVPVVHTLHDYASMCSNGALIHSGHICTGNRLRCRATGGLHRRLSKQVSGVIGVGTEILRRHLAAGFFRQVPQSRRMVLWNAIEPPPRCHRHARPGQITFGYLGRIEQSKGSDLLIEACHRLPQGGWSLCMAGDAPQGFAPYRAMADGLPITFPGRTDARSFYARIDCLVVPSLWPEAFGRTVAEALLRGIPVIGADTAGIGEQLRAWGAGWLFPPGDGAALAEIMAGIVTGQTLLPRVARRPDLEGRLSPEHVAESMIALYRAVLAEPEAQPRHRSEMSPCR